MNSRESIYAALFKNGAACVGFKSSGRRLRHIDDLSPSEFPVFYQVQVQEQWVHPNGGAGNLPPIGVLNVEWWVYVENSDGITSHSAQLNPLVDALLASIGLPPAVTRFGKQNLGGIVESVQLSGAIQFAEGAIANRGFARIPLVIKTPG